MFVTVRDPVAGDAATGRLRIDRRSPAQELSPPKSVLVVVGGMTQTLSSWGGQVRHLAERRELVVVEARGQGQTELALDDCSIGRHVKDMLALLDALEISRPVDLCGFSFGGRVCMAFAAEHPERAHRLVLTGVGPAQSTLGRVIVRGWRAALTTGDLHALAWISLADTLGPSYLARNEAHLDSMVLATLQRNRYEGIHALFEHTSDEKNHAFAVSALAERVSCPTLLLGGSLDRLVPREELEGLARRMRAAVTTFPDVGHTVPIEAPQPWRERVLAFLDEPDG